MKCTNTSHVLGGLFLLAVGSFFGYIFGLQAYNSLPDRPWQIQMYEELDMKEYLSTTGTFTLYYPEDTVVYEEDGIVTIATEPSDEVPEPDPYMTIGIAEDKIEFATWEDLEFEHFREVVSSFSFRD